MECLCRASFAAAVALLQGFDALSQGSVPLVPTAHRVSGGDTGKLQKSNRDREGLNERSSSDSDVLEAANGTAGAQGGHYFMKVKNCPQLNGPSAN